MRKETRKAETSSSGGFTASRNGNPTTNWRQEKSCRQFAFLAPPGAALPLGRKTGRGAEEGACRALSIVGHVILCDAKS